MFSFNKIQISIYLYVTKQFNTVTQKLKFKVVGKKTQNSTILNVKHRI